jgi:branched-chain amino acid transport system permease protein
MPVGFGAQFWQLTVDGTKIGALYAVIALGYTLVYGVLQLINFAHSEVFMFGAMGGVLTVRAVQPQTTASGFGSVLLVVVGLVCGALAGAVAAFVLERTAYRPLRRRNAPKLAYLISAIGASLFGANLAGKLFGRQNIPLNADLFRDHTLFHLFNASVTLQTVVILVTAVAMLVVLDRLVAGTKLGASIRAVAQDADTASLMGVNVERIIVFTFVIGGLLAGAGGFLYALTFNASWNMGFIPGVKAFTAAVLGGIGNVRGAVIGGLGLGLIESYGGFLFSAAYKDVIAFLVLVLVLLIRPSGLLGERLGRAA